MSTPRFGPYQIIKQLGEGAFGIVYRATDDSGAELALKVLHKHVAGDPEVARRFRREGKLGLNLSHPNVVRVIAAGEIDGTLYQASEFVTGGSLADLILRDHKLTVPRTLAVAHDLFAGLDALSKHGIIHRDIKPANLLLDAQGIAKLTDFGMARPAQSDRSFMTMEGMVMGSPSYMSPEQVRGETDTDIRADLYAAGVLMFECLTGRTVFPAPTVYEIMRGHLEKAPPDLVKEVRGIPEPLAALVADLLRKRPDQRPQTPAATLARLAPLLKAAGISARPASPPPPPPRPPPPPLPPALKRDPTPVPVEHQTMMTMYTAPAQPPKAGGGSTFVTSATMPANTVASDGAVSVGGTPVDELSQTMPTMAAENLLSATRPTIPVVPVARVFQPTATSPGLVRARLSAGGRIWFVYAGAKLTCGRDGLERADQDVCLRVFPAAKSAERSRKISAQHLRFEVSTTGATVKDLGSAGGSWFDGERMTPQQAQVLPAQCTVQVSDALLLVVRQIPTGPGDRIDGVGACAPIASLVVERPENGRPKPDSGGEHAYLLIPGSCRLTTAGGALVPAASGALTLLNVNGRLWLASDDQRCMPLLPGLSATCGELKIQVAEVTAAEQKG